MIDREQIERMRREVKESLEAYEKFAAGNPDFQWRALHLRDLLRLLDGIEERDRRIEELTARLKERRGSEF